MQFKDFNWLSHMIYQPLYHALQIWYANFLDKFIYFFYFSFLYFGGVFNKTINPAVLLGYEVVIATSYPIHSCGILIIVTDITLTVWYNLMTWYRYINSICWHQSSKYLDTNKSLLQFYFP